MATQLILSFLVNLAIGFAIGFTVVTLAIHLFRR